MAQRENAGRKAADIPPEPGASPPGPPSTARPVTVEVHRADRDRTLTAMHALEAALAEAGPGRERSWRNAVLAALHDLSAATAQEDHHAAQPDSLLGDIARTQPRLRTRVRGLRSQYRHLHEAIDRFRVELDADADITDVPDVRQRLAWLLTALRHQRARESDLIYDAYYEAFDRDVEDDLGR